MYKNSMPENQKTKKICIAIHGLSHAGAERVAASWANYLVSQRYEVSVIIYAYGADVYKLDERVKIVTLAKTREEYFSTSKIKQVLSIRKAVRDEMPDCMISFLPKMQISMMLATVGMRFKRFETVRNNPWIDKDVVGKRFLWNLCFNRCDVILVQTEEQATYFPQKLNKKCVVISNPISNKFSERQKEYKDCKITKFIAVARINDQKNYPMMVRAFAQVATHNPQLELDIYGAGTQEKIQNLENLISQLGMENQIHMCGWRKDIDEVLTSYDAFLMSSDYEGMPNALAEAMGAGLVCLSTDCRTGPKDMIESGESGFLVSTGNEKAFADRIEEIIKMDVHQCAVMGNAAREKILDMCSEENTLMRLKQVIESVV